MSNRKLFCSIFAILFVVYNVVLFMIAGVADGTATFWVSYAFMIVAFLVVLESGIVLGKSGMQLKDWLFGYPIVKHCIAYVAIEFICSVIFMLLHEIVGWQAAFVVQLLLVAVYSIFAISCFISKNTIEEQHDTVRQKTMNIQLLRAEAEMLAEETNDMEAKKVFAAFAEQVRYSDPMSSDGLQMLESKLIQTVGDARAALKADDVPAALKLCEEARLLLIERNKKAMILK